MFINNSITLVKNSVIYGRNKTKLTSRRRRSPREAPHLAVAAADPDGGADGLDGVNSVHRDER